MAINSKKKGSRFERAICKWWSEWTGYDFNRVPASGGLRWKNAENITSDVACTDSKHSRKFCFSIECKSYQELDFEGLLLGRKSCKVAKFWEQASDDARRAKKLPILIMKYNGMGKGEAFVMVDYKVWMNCIAGKVSKLDKPIWAFYLNPKRAISESALYVMLLSELKKLDYSEFHKSATKVRKNLYKTK